MSKKLDTNYNDDSIKSLKGADRVRLRPGVMFGSDNIKGAFHTFKEILGNSLDEARGGYGKEIEVVYYKDGAISVRDYGRGVPMGWNQSEERWNWDLVFNELYAGGKYEDDEVYKFSVGLNGLGAAAVQYVSEYFIVESYQGDKMYKKEFAKGNPSDMKKPIEVTLDEEQHGTFIKWKIDNEVFRNTNFKFKDFLEYCEGQAHINEVNFTLTDEKSGETARFEGKGIEYYLREQVGDNVIEVLQKKEKTEGFEERNQRYTAVCELCLAITEETESKQLFFHNTATMTTGYHIQAVQDAVSGFFKALGKKNGVTIMPYDYNDYLSILVSSYSNITSFANQTKDGVDNKFIYDLVKKTVSDLLEESVAKGLNSMNVLMENVVNAAIARKKAKELESQERLIRKTTGGKKVKAEKYVDCRSNDPKEKELFILEGDSALGSCKNARDSKFQALLPVRGKTLNCLKAPIEQVLENKVIKDLITTLGCGVDIGGSEDLFDINKLQFDKVILTTDADTDGFQIRVLLYTVFYRLMPELLRKGKVYVAETPLFEIVLGGKDGSLFAYSVEEKNKILADLEKKGKKFKKIFRSKGLGENTKEMLWMTTMNPETRRLVPLTMDIVEENVVKMSNMLFGNDTDNERKDYIFEMLSEGLVDLEVENSVV